MGRLDQSQQQSGEEFNTLFQYLAVNQGTQQEYIRQLQKQEWQTLANHLAFKRRFKEETRSQDLLHDQEKVEGTEGIFMWAPQIFNFVIKNWGGQHCNSHPKSSFHWEKIFNFELFWRRFFVCGGEAKFIFIFDISVTY